MNSFFSNSVSLLCLWWTWWIGWDDSGWLVVCFGGSSFDPRFNLLKCWVCSGCLTLYSLAIASREEDGIVDEDCSCGK